MRNTSYYPVLMTGDVAGTAAFYERHFRFVPAFAADWYVHLTSTDDPETNLAVLDHTHESIPPEGRSLVSGIIPNFEVEDVEYARLVGGRASDAAGVAGRAVRAAAFHHARSQWRADRRHHANRAVTGVRGPVCVTNKSIDGAVILGRR